MPLVELPPLRRDSLGGTLGDVDCQLQEGHPYKDADRVTWTHEATHGVNARLRNEHRADIGLYYLNCRGFVIPASPRFTLADLANEIPTEKRGRLYQLYLKDQQRWWNDSPLYVLDELTAYTYGAKAGFELGLTDRGEESRDNAREMWKYSRVAAAMARRDDYEHQSALDEFLDSFHKEHLSPLLGIN
jgi:hypothetical protein